MRLGNHITMGLILVFAAFACGSDETVPPEGSGATGAPTSSSGGGGSGGTGANGGEVPQGGGGGGGASSGGGGAGAGTPAPVTAPTELNNANGVMTGSSYRLSFQLGRPIHQPAASGTTHDLVCAAPTLADQ